MNKNFSGKAGKELSLEIIPVTPIPDFLLGEIHSKLAYIDEEITGSQVERDRIILTFQSTSSQTYQDLSPERKSEIEDKVQTMVQSMAKGAVHPRSMILEDFLDRPLHNNEDPTQFLFDHGELSREATGIYSLGPLFSQLIDFFEERFVSIAGSFGARNYRFPTLISPHMLERVNYFSAFPHSLSFVSHLRQDLHVIDRFAQSAACDEHGLIAPSDSFAQVQALLSPAVCYHLYFLLSDKPLENGRLSATAVGNCFRYESINHESLERLWNFTMREIIFVGSKDYILDNREQARQKLAAFFEEIGLAYRVESANDPFFIGEFRKQAAFQSAFQLKYEVRAALPFKSATIAIGSYNYHQDFFGRNLGITLPDGKPAHTGCVAFGLERTVFSFLAQYGLDVNKWPASIQSYLQ